MYKYQTTFYLLADVLDLDEAQAYLEEDNMLYYFDNEEIKRKLQSIKWHLTDCGSGYIEVIANEELAENELDEISAYISGQNADGIGESFEQQDFASYDAALLNDRGEIDDSLLYDDDYEEDWVMASFDWNSNYYVLELVAKD